ncbi:hypothetical protein V6M85_07800 [Sulfolobus tengchongensis]|uniref:Uncharacterized protein n=1 Tax=Sulfolobus tengchongensis TaxID=207809 RepID=A0AAX4KWY7_9CREN
MIAVQTYEIPLWIEERKKEIIAKTLEIPIGGSIFYFDIPNNPMVYVSESNGVLYINGSSYWESELYMLKDLKDEFVYQTLQLSKAMGRNVSKMDDMVVEVDNKKLIEKRKFYILLDNKIEVGFYYNLYLPDGKRNGIIEIVPYYKQYHD